MPSTSGSLARRPRDRTSNRKPFHEIMLAVPVVLVVFSFSRFFLLW
jgi:hypothetical protein